MVEFDQFIVFRRFLLRTQKTEDVERPTSMTEKMEMYFYASKFMIPILQDVILMMREEARIEGFEAFKPCLDFANVYDLSEFKNDLVDDYIHS